jgi:hypothetical protein
MSCIYFHSIDKDVRVRGAERAYAGNLCANIALAALRQILGPDDPPPIIDFIPTGHYLRRTWLPEAFGTWFRVGWKGGLIINGEVQENFTVALNTALVAGSDSIKLLARLHGQCELNAYVEGPDRDWLADIVEQGLETGVMRSNMGWAKVIQLLHSTSDVPVVTSYSVTDQFPNAHYANWEKVYEDDGVHYSIEDSWYELSAHQQWERALVGLRSKNEKKRLQLSPEDWDTFDFGNGMNAFRIVEEVLKVAERVK